jgi:hypothetical protein
MPNHIGQMIIEKFVSRSKTSSNIPHIIILAITNYLNAKTKSTKDHGVLICGSMKATVTMNRFRHAVNLVEKQNVHTSLVIST